MTNEEFYDTEVGPKLAELARACEARGMSFVSSVEYEPESTAETFSLIKGHSVKITLAYMAIKAHGNLDSLVIGAARYARDHGHSSMVLNLLKIPLTPEPAARGERV